MKNLDIVGLGIRGKRLLSDFSKISNVVGCTSTPLEIETKEFIRNLNCKPDYSNSDKSIKILNLIEKCRKLLK